ncbi:MAG: glycosyltransferase family 39 protein [Vicinamibacterales bacterium]
MIAGRPGHGAWRLAAVVLLFIGLTAVMTWPQVEYLGTRARQHQDVYFNLWRLGWVAHALHTSPSALFDGNIFHPERRTLTYSDAMIVEGAVAAPLLWAGVRPMLVHNLMLLGAIVASAVGMFVLVRSLTGSSAGGLLAGIVFAFVPYRVEHYMHMELQWTMWMPWSFWALHRTMTSKAWRDGLLTGLFVGLQMLSSIYYGIFLATLLGLSAVLLLLSQSRDEWWPTLKALIPGGVLAMLLCGAYALPYLETKAQTGGRSTAELVTFSARPSSYLVATPDNVVWGRSFASRGRTERRLFPGAVVVLLALIGLLLRPPPRVALVYLVGLTVAFDMSLGLSGYSYRVLYQYVPLYQGLRALARLGIFVVFFLAPLAAFGYLALAARLPRRSQPVLAVALGLAMLLEYRVRPLDLVPYPDTAPPLYAWLAQQPRGVVAELPMPPDGAPGSEPAYTYLSTFHWQPIVNGYSGFYPQSYLSRLADTAQFPDERSLRRLQRDGVRYLVVHLGEFPAARREEVLRILREGFGLSELTRQADGVGEAVVLSLR